MRADEIKNEINDIKKWENKIKWKDLKYKTNRYKFDFQQFEILRSFGDSIYNGKVRIDEAEMEKTNLIENIVNVSKKPLAKSVLIPLRLMAAAWVTDAATYKRMSGSGTTTTTLIISNEEMNEIMKIIYLK